MSMIWYPPGMEIHVGNPGYGELTVYAYPGPYDGPPLVDEEWHLDLYGGQIGEFLSRVLDRVLGFDRPRPGYLALPTFITVPVARTLLPPLQQAALLAAAGGEKYDRIYRDQDEPPPEPLCARCGEGTIYTPGAMRNEWCEQYGHKPFGDSIQRWDHAQEMHTLRRDRWDRDRDRREQEENARTMFVMKIMGLANGGRTALAGRYLVEYDPTRPGTGPHGEPTSAHIDTTDRLSRARRFADQAEAHDYWRTPSGRPAPADRPLTAYHVSIERLGA